MSITPKRWVRRVYEKTALVAVRKVRTIVLFWARQCRKSTNLGSIAFDEMSREPGRRVIAASASLLVGSELVSKTIGAAEQAALVDREAAAMQMAMQHGAAANDKVQMRVANSSTGKEYSGLSADDFADLYKSARLEMRMYHDQTVYSRLQVIAPNPATARGWTGTVIRDEAGFTPTNLETELQGAVAPIIDADPTFKLIYASNLPRDDRHPFFEMTLPPPDMNFEAKAEGHFYRGQDGILIHRVSLADAYAAGHVLYDHNSGAPLTYEEFCAKPGNKLHLPWNYKLLHESGGSAAIDLVAMQTAQRRGATHCAFVFVDSDRDFQRACDLLRAHLGCGKVGIGFDVATTTHDISNPSSVTITEQAGIERYARLICVWKEKKPQVARERLRELIRVVEHRPEGGRARRLCIDASNERYFAEETADIFRALIPVELVTAGVSVQPPGYREATNYKTWLGDTYSTAVNENHYSLPADEYIKRDQRAVWKNAGRYECTPEPDGKHGDTFDSSKLAEHALNEWGEPGHIKPVQRGGSRNRAAKSREVQA
jgi:hypothetical protein